MDDTTLWPVLLDQWPILFAFVTSFATIGMMWINHHRLFSHIKRSDTALMLMALNLSISDCLYTLILQSWLRSPSSIDQHAAALLYSGTSILLAVAFNLLWRYASSRIGCWAKMFMHELSRHYRSVSLWPSVLPYLVWPRLAQPFGQRRFSLLYAVFFALPGRPRRKAIRYCALRPAVNATDTAQEADG